MTGKELNQRLLTAYLRALTHLPEISRTYSSNKRKRNAKLSKIWVENLAGSLMEYEAKRHSNLSDGRIEAFFLSGQQKTLGLSEFLHDICIARTSTVRAPKHKKNLRVVTQVLWQVESEFNSNTREAVWDLNKLIAGSAVSKLFIGPYKGKSRQAIQAASAYRNTLASTLGKASHTEGDKWFLGQIPHPDIWNSSDSHPVACWEYCPETKKWVT